MFMGWLSAGGAEVVNSARTVAYCRSNISATVRDCDDCEDLAQVLGDPPYSQPFIDRPDWFDAGDQATWDFYGLILTDVSGIDDSTVKAEPVELNAAGGYVPMPRKAGREMVFTATMFALDRAAMSAGMTWLSRALAGDQCGANGGCTGDHLCFLTDCPPMCEDSPELGDDSPPLLLCPNGEPATYPDSCVLDFERHLYRVSTIDGPHRTAETLLSRGLMWEVEWTMYAAVPDVYSTPRYVASSHLTAGVQAAQTVIATNLAPDPRGRASTSGDFGTTKTVGYVTRDAALGFERRNWILDPRGASARSWSWSAFDGAFDVLAVDPPTAEHDTPTAFTITTTPHDNPNGTGESASFLESVTRALDGPTTAAGRLDDYVRLHANDANNDGTITIEADPRVHGYDTRGWAGSVYVRAGQTGMSLVLAAGEGTGTSMQLVAGEWTRVGLPAPAADSPVPWALLVQPRGLRPGAVLDISGALLETDTQVVRDYIDGSRPGDGKRTWIWDGAQNNSPSLQVPIIGDSPEGVGYQYASATADAPDQATLRRLGPTDKAHLIAGVKANAQYGVRLWQYVPSYPAASLRTKLVAVWLDDTGATLRTDQVVVDQTKADPEAPVGAWKLVEGTTKLAPAYAASLALVPEWVSNGALEPPGRQGQTFAWAARIVEQGSSVPVGYFDGDTDDQRPFDYEWIDGTDGTSVQVLMPDSIVIHDDDCPDVPDSYPPINDPACVVPLPPRPPLVINSCLTSPTDWTRYQVDIPADDIPLWSDAVPIIRVRTGAKDIAQVRFRFYPNPLNKQVLPIGGGCADYCGEFVVSYAPKNSLLVIDGVERMAWIETYDPDTLKTYGSQRLAATHLLYATDGGPMQWPELSCEMPYSMTIDLADTAVTSSVIESSLCLAIRA